MAWIPIVQVDITLNTAGSTREGFGLPLFVTATDAFADRYQTYTSIEAVIDDFPDEHSPVQKAATALWSQTPKVTQLYVGRRDVQYSVNLLTVPNDLDIFSITLTDKNGITSNPSYTAVANDTAENVCRGLMTAIQGDATFANIVNVTVSGQDANATLLLDTTQDDVYFKVFSVDTKLQVTTTPSDTIPTAMAKIEDYTKEWYFVALDSRLETDQQAMATHIASTSKIFFTANADTDALVGEGQAVQVATDFPAWLANRKHERTACLWHQTAVNGGEYPEMAYIAYGAPYDAGSISWGNALLTGVDFSRQSNDTKGKPLTTGQKGALEARNCNYIDAEGGQNLVRHGKVASGEWIDIIRGRDWLEVELRGDLRDLLISQKGGKITYDDVGITRIRQVIETGLQRAVNRRFLESFTVTVPRALDVSVADKRARLLKDVKFQGILAGAINDVQLSGTVSYE